MGFAWDDRRVRRTAMDYVDHVEVVRHDGLESFRESAGDSRFVLFTTKATVSPYDFEFRGDDILLFGRESSGVPPNASSPCAGSYFRCASGR